MLFIVETAKDFETAAKDLEEAVKRRHYGVLHIHDLQKTLQSKGIDFPRRVKIFEVWHSAEADKGTRVGQRIMGTLPLSRSLCFFTRHFQ